MTIIVCIIIFFALILIAWMWHNLGDIEKSKKVTYIVETLIVMYFLTFIIYNLSKIGIKYNNKEVMNTIRTIYVSIFTLVNSALIFPHLFKKMDQLNNEEIKPEDLRITIERLLILIIIIFVFEFFYLGNIQKEIINIRNSK